MPRKRLYVLGLTLVLTLAAAAWVSGAPDGVSGVAAPAAERAARPRTDSAGAGGGVERVVLPLDRLQRAPMAVGELNPFQSKSWYVPPPPPPPAPPPKPTAPPLPFQYMGKLEKANGPAIVYLVKGNESFAVSPGETFDRIYRLEGVEGGALVILYLPLSIRQTLAIDRGS